MPSGRTSMLELPANVLLAAHPACSERRHPQSCRRPYERKLGDQTKDDADKEPPEERSCGRSQTLLYNEVRTHLSLEQDAPVSPSIAPGAFCVAESGADCIPNLPGSNFRPPDIASLYD